MPSRTYQVSGGSYDSESPIPTNHFTPPSNSIAAAMPPVAVLSGCNVSDGDHRSVNTQEVEQFITEQFRAQGVPLTGVTCADGIEAVVGAPVSCTGQNDAESNPETGRNITEVDGDRYRTNVTAVSATIDDKRIAERSEGPA